MPSTYAHFCFGREVLAALPQEMQSLLWPEQNLCSIGLHGPDILFFDHPLLGRAEPGDLFAEAYACAPDELLLVDVVASEACEVLFLDAKRILTQCTSTCEHHSRIIRNLVGTLAHKNLALSRRSLHTGPRTIRARLLSYLGEQAQRAGSRSFTIPFDRQQLADYLNVERSALSNELSKMQRDGLLTCRRSSFCLLCEF